MNFVKPFTVSAKRRRGKKEGRKRRKRKEKRGADCGLPLWMPSVGGANTRGSQERLSQVKRRKDGVRL